MCRISPRSSLAIREPFACASSFIIWLGLQEGFSQWRNVLSLSMKIINKFKALYYWDPEGNLTNDTNVSGKEARGEFMDGSR